MTGWQYAKEDGNLQDIKDRLGSTDLELVLKDHEDSVEYDGIYNDQTYKTFIKTDGYKNRGMVFAGGNDGMLHALG